MKFAGKVEQGKLTLDDNLGFRDYLRQIEGNVHLEIKPRIHRTRNAQCYKRKV